MSGVNKVIILGKLGQDPELKHTPNGAAVCNMSIATSEKWKDKTSGEAKSETQWHRVVVWGKMAELCNQYLAKGRDAYVEGKLQTRSWEDKDGNKRYTTEINATTVQFIGGQDRAASNGADNSNQDVNTKSDANFATDSIPF